MKTIHSLCAYFRCDVSWFCLTSTPYILIADVMKTCSRLQQKFKTAKITCMLVTALHHPAAWEKINPWRRVENIDWYIYSEVFSDKRCILHFSVSIISNKVKEIIKMFNFLSHLTCYFEMSVISFKVLQAYSISNVFFFLFQKKNAQSCSNTYKYTVMLYFYFFPLCSMNKLSSNKKNIFEIIHLGSFSGCIMNSPVCLWCCLCTQMYFQII